MGLLRGDGAAASVCAVRRGPGHLEPHPQVVAGIVQTLRWAAGGHLGGESFEVFAVGPQFIGREVARDDLAQAASVVGLLLPYLLNAARMPRRRGI